MIKSMRAHVFISRHRRELLEAIVVFAVALLPRLIGIGLFLTADEKVWVARSYEFVKALRELRINDTLQTTHPGITTLWVAGVTTVLATRFFHTPFTMGDLHRFVTAAQLPMAVGNALLVTVIFLAARRIFGRRSAWLGALLVSLDPFLIGYSKVVHVDAFLTGFLVVSLLLLLRAREETMSGWALVGSAIMGALAILSKLPGIIIVPFGALIFLLPRPAAGLSRRASARRFFQWLFLLVTTVLLLWPALLWVPNPRGNVNLVRRDITTAFITPHNMEESYTISAWHYPATLLTRSSLPTLGGVVSVLLLLLFPRGRRSLAREVPLRAVGGLVLFVVLFLGMMLVGAKKGDRYTLPVFPVLDLVAAAGWTTAAALISRREAVWRWVVAGSVGVLALTLFRLGPYALAYYNPLFPPNMSQELGWGEGLDQVAKFLDAQPGNTLVASWYPEELRALTRKPVIHINGHMQVRVGSVVLYRNMFGRSTDHWANDFIDEYYRKRDPVFTAWVNGLPYAWVYRKPTYTGTVGELLPGDAVVTELPAAGANLSRIDLLAATFSGRARSGFLTVHVRERIAAPDLRTVSLPVAELPDTRFAEFSMDPIPDSQGKTYVVVVTAQGTRAGDAPTIRVAPAERASSYVLMHGARAERRTGLLGMRWYFVRHGREISREEVERVPTAGTP